MELSDFVPGYAAELLRRWQAIQVRIGCQRCWECLSLQACWSATLESGRMLPGSKQEKHIVTFSNSIREWISPTFEAVIITKRSNITTLEFVSK